MQAFELIGRRQIFLVAGRYMAAGFIDTVIGHTIDGRWKTHARTVDVIDITNQIVWG
jgi:hypothetical protein